GRGYARPTLAATILTRNTSRPRAPAAAGRRGAADRRESRAPTLAASVANAAASLLPEGAQFAPWGGPRRECLGDVQLRLGLVEKLFVLGGILERGRRRLAALDRRRDCV